MESAAATAPQELWFVPVDAAAPRRVEVDAKRLGMPFDVTTNGRHIAYTIGEDRLKVWTMENFLPMLKAKD